MADQHDSFDMELEEFESSERGEGSLFARVADLYAEAVGDAAIGRARPALTEQFLGLIRAYGCDSPGDGDYTDARYFIDRAALASATTDAAVTADVDAIPGIQQCLTATNLAESAAGTHLLPAGTIVQVFALYSRSSPPVKNYVFHATPDATVIVELTGAAAGAGEYNGRVLDGLSTASPTSALSMPAGMTIPSSDDALVLNVEEDGLSGHRLKANTYAIGRLVGMTTESTPRWIVMVRGGKGETVSPTTLGNGTGGSISADASTWSGATNGTPLNLWVQTRTFWDTSGTVLYAYLRQLSFDARGLLIAVSAENQITVDSTQSCP
jgi:hypothetical protein